MSQSEADDPDPLLEFSSEPNAAIPIPTAPKAVAQPVVATVDLASAIPQPSPSLSTEALLARIDRLESALVDSKFQVSTLKSELATLVRAISDIKKQARSPETKKPLPAPSLPSAVRSPKAASAILAAIVGLSAAVFALVYFMGAPNATAAGSEPKLEEAAFVPADQPAVPAEAGKPAPLPVPPPTQVAARVPARAPAPPKQARVAPAPVARTPAPETRVRYVGSLSIDSQPGEGEVFVNREHAGRTPLRLDDLKAGSHLIWVEREGYRRWTRVVQVPADRITRLFADLEPIAAR